jgi:hypothetical protein
VNQQNAALNLSIMHFLAECNNPDTVDADEDEEY